MKTSPQSGASDSFDQGERDVIALRNASGMHEAAADFAKKQRLVMVDMAIVMWTRPVYHVPGSIGS